MLSPTGSSASIVVCSSCKFNSERKEDQEGRRGGRLLVDAVRSEAASRNNPDIIVEEMACFFACSRFCTVHLRADGKISYILGDFQPGPDAAKAIVDYFEHYLESDTGVVPYRDWPEGVKGHFITRSPPPQSIVG